MRHLVVLSLMTCLGIAAAADAKQPWEWTSRERAEARRDPAKRRERLREDEAERRTWPASAKRFPPAADVINGARHPELFFVTELFQDLVRSAFVTLPDVYPQVVRQRTSDLFRNADDWKRFATITANYAAVLRTEHNAVNALDKNAVAAVQPRKCAAEARALRQARRTFGKTRFDRMLYETVPVSMVSSFSADTNFEVSIGSALARDERCQ
jgi:hypothetical protein